MSFLDIFRVGKIKAELEETRRERDSLKKTIEETGLLEVHEAKLLLEKLEQERQQILANMRVAEEQAEEKKHQLRREVALLEVEISQKKKSIIVLDEMELLQSFGFYTPRYNLMDSEAYKTQIERIRAEQSRMVKDGTAASGSTTWKLNNSEKEGAKMIKDYVKLILRSFNNECDASIVGVKFNNVDSVEKKLIKAFETLNKLGDRMSISISRKYLNLKLEELHLCYEYQVKKQEEKEEQKRIREQMREEAKAMREIEEMKAKLEKEERHFTQAYQKLNDRLKGAQTEAEKEIIQQELGKIEDSLTQLNKDKLDILNREKNTRAGYVYIISNVGAFGENVYKIGMTRRLEPQERVDELGDASVPFNFDVHALIFSDDAPALENALHKAFEDRRLNMINRRREFFRVTLGEIETVVKRNFSKPVEFLHLADAEEYRQSLMLKEGK